MFDTIRHCIALNNLRAKSTLQALYNQSDFVSFSSHAIISEQYMYKFYLLKEWFWNYALFLSWLFSTYNLRIWHLFLGFLTYLPVEGVAFLKTDANAVKEQPDIQLHFLSVSLSRWRRYLEQDDKGRASIAEEHSKAMTQSLSHIEDVLLPLFHLAPNVRKINVTVLVSI